MPARHARPGPLRQGQFDQADPTGAAARVELDKLPPFIERDTQDGAVANGAIAGGSSGKGRISHGGVDTAAIEPEEKDALPANSQDRRQSPAAASSGTKSWPLTVGGHGAAHAVSNSSDANGRAWLDLREIGAHRADADIVLFRQRPASMTRKTIRRGGGDCGQPP